MSQGLARLLLAACAASLAAALFFGWAWLDARRRPAIDELSALDRQALVQDLLERSPGAHQWTYFEPRIGYTLRPDTELDVWHDRFTSNELGYRSGPVAKVADTLRVLFVGDSWTYGMGIRRDQAFAEVFAGLANRHAAERRRVEAWILALPGYNTMNELAALWFFFGRLQPDVVVLCPASNDNHSTLPVLPTGSTTERGTTIDEFGDPHTVAYHGRRLTSYRYQERWRRSFAAIRGTAERLRDLKIPFLIFFVGRWPEVDAHALMAESGVPAPYVVVPIELTKGRWSSQAHGHGTPEANRLYAQMVYGAVARLLGWRALPDPDPRARVPVFDGPPAGTDWRRRYAELAREDSAKLIPESFRPPRLAERQAVGPFEARTGLLGGATTILVRRRAGGKQLAIAVERLPDAPYLYPLDLTVSIPSPAGGTRSAVLVPAADPEPYRFRVDIPADLAADAVLDVVFVAGRTTAGTGVLAPRSLFIASIEPAD